MEHSLSTAGVSFVSFVLFDASIYVGNSNITLENIFIDKSAG